MSAQPDISNRPSGAVRPPDRTFVNGAYELSWVHTQAELHAVQELRYNVFNLELNEGLDASHDTGRDSDRYDDVFHHLFVRHVPSGRIVGTYRMQTASMARAGQGWYSRNEFDFSSVPSSILDRSVETGRACILREHRSLKVLYLLWKGIGYYLQATGTRFLFGCCSLTSQDPLEGRAVYAYLVQHGHMHPDVHIFPQPDHACCDEIPAGSTIEPVRPPRLMRAYLSFGARICGPPAMDREFKTIDFLALFDVKNLQESDLAFYTLS
ncbi:MAG: hemolysin [Bacteroidetes bacterium CG12_big_fil_rev_8_21_14_0_65_60_17]|nr:MAG: hemolysin [Bacteroidetes bacterium CG12_big_fil_rev_8_21_14_0_65_60_17]